MNMSWTNWQTLFPQRSQSHLAHRAWTTMLNGTLTPSSIESPCRTAKIEQWISPFCITWLLVSTPLKNITQMGDDGSIIPNIWKNEKCSKPPTRLLHCTSIVLSYCIYFTLVSFSRRHRPLLSPKVLPWGSRDQGVSVAPWVECDVDQISQRNMRCTHLRWMALNGGAMS